jgi:PKD repeat protein
VTLSWSFGDGSTATGTSVSHAFTAAGSPTVIVTATDGVGNTAAKSGVVTVSQPRQRHPAAPLLAAVSETHPEFRVGSAPTTLSVKAHKKHRRPPVGTTFLFTLNEDANVSIQIKHSAAGRLAAGKCVKPSKKLNGHKHCTRTVVVGTLVRAGKAGADRVPFSGRLGRAALKPGPYLVTITATAGRLTSTPRTLSFTIVS